MATKINQYGGSFQSSLHKIFIVDDHPMMRRGYRALFVDEEDLYVCGEAGSPNEAIEKISSTHPDLVIMDLSMGGKGNVGGLGLIRHLHGMLPELPIVVSSSYEKELYEQRACQAGAVGYVQKCDFLNQGTMLIRAILNCRA